MSAPRLGSCVILAVLVLSAPPGGRAEVPKLPAPLTVLHAPEDGPGADRACLAVSADGKRLASATEGKGILVWDVETGKTVSQGAAAGYHTNFLSFGPTNDTLLWGTWGRVQRFRLGEESALLTAQVTMPTAATSSLSQDGKLLACAGEDHTLRLYRVGDEIQYADKLEGHTAYLSSVAFSPDGKVLASGSNDRTLRLWDVATRKILHVCEGHADQVSAVAFAPPGSKTVASASWDGTVRLWDLASGKAGPCLRGHRLEVHAVAFAPDGASLASAGADGTVRIWDVKKGKEIRRWVAHKWGVLALAYTRDGKGILTADSQHAVRLWDLTGKEVRRFETTRAVRPASEVYCCAWAPNGRTVALGRLDGTIRLHDAATGKELRVVGRHPGHVWSLAFSPDGQTLASSARRHGAVRIWDVNTGALVRSLPGHLGGISRVLFTPDGKGVIAAGGSFEPVILLHDLKTGKNRRLEGHTNYIESLALAPGGKTLASAGLDGTVRLWDVEAGKELRQWEGGSAHGMKLGFLRGGKVLLAQSRGQTACTYDVGSGEVLRDLPDMETWSALSPDGRSVAGGGDGLAVYELATGLPRRTFESPASCLAFSPDSRRLLATSGATGVIRDLVGEARGAEVGAGELGALWDALAGEDASRALDAVWRLALSPGKSVPYLRARLKPAVAPDEKKVLRWIVELDDDSFEVRQKATAELEKVADTARLHLERALAARPSVEVHRRLKLILARLDRLPPEKRRELRALEALEQAGTPEARAVLAALARGAPGAALTSEASWALGRMR